MSEKLLPQNSMPGTFARTISRRAVLRGLGADERRESQPALDVHRRRLWFPTPGQLGTKLGLEDTENVAHLKGCFEPFARTRLTPYSASTFFNS